MTVHFYRWKFSSKWFELFKYDLIFAFRMTMTKKCKLCAKLSKCSTQQSLVSLKQSKFQQFSIQWVNCLMKESCKRSSMRRIPSLKEKSTLMVSVISPPTSSKKRMTKLCNSWVHPHINLHNCRLLKHLSYYFFINRELKEAFRLYDREGNGYITTSTLKEILGALDDKLTSTDLDGIIAEIDTDGSGTVDFDEFMEMMTGELKINIKKSISITIITFSFSFLQVIKSSSLMRLHFARISLKKKIHFIFILFSLQYGDNVNSFLF